MRGPRASLADFELVPVDESGYVKHTCGHTVWWQLMPGCSNDFLRGASRAACPVCGGETGVVQENVEWPCHVAFAHVGIAHCHRPWQTCEMVEAKHRLGLATVDNEGIEAQRKNPRPRERFML